MNGKSIGMLMMAVVCGLGAMFGTTKLISRGPSKAEEEMQDVVVAARDLKVEETIKPELVKIIRMTKSAVPPGAFSVTKDVEERWVTISLLENEPVVEKKLAAKGSPPGLVGRIPPGMRAVAIEVNEQTGVSGFVLPDHRVDIIQVTPGKNGLSEAETVLQDVLVLASGQTLTRPEDKSIQARTVTLAVTPEQGDALAEAKARGSLSLSLRGLNDHEKNITKRQKERDLPPPPPKAPVEEVVVVKPPEPPPPIPEPTPAPPPPAPVVTTKEPPAKFLAIHRGLGNMLRLRVDVPMDPESGETLPTVASNSSLPPPPDAAPAVPKP